jgi:nephrocystin-3
MSTLYLERERSEHEAFAASRRRVYVEQRELFIALERFATGLDRNDERLLVVHGGSGSGKSALLANWSQHLRRVRPDIFVVEHYVGAGASTTSNVDAIRHIVSEIVARFGLGDAVPSDAEAVANDFPIWLARVPIEIVIIIDALDQLDEDSQAMRWLPSFLPGRVSFIVSTSSPTITRCLIDRGARALEVQPLGREDRLAVLRLHISSQSGTIDAAHLERLVEPGLAANPLFLRTTVQSIIDDRDDQRGESIERYLTATSLGELFDRVFDRMEERDGPERLTDAIRLIASSRRGLHSGEIADLLALDDAGVSDVLAPLRFHTTEWRGVVSFSHNQVRQSAIARYLSDDATRTRMHETLAAYFDARPKSSRRADEVPWQWMRAGNWTMLESSLLDPSLVTTLSNDPTQHDLLTYWRALDGMDCASSYSRALELWKASDDTSVIGPAVEAVADLLTKQGAFQAASEWIGQAVSVGSTDVDGTHPARTTRRLGMLAYYRAELDEAERLLREALGSLPSDMGESNDLSVEIRGDLASILTRKGAFDEALAILEELQADASARSDTRRQAEYLNNLGAINKARGDYERAIDLLTRAHELNERHFGIAHPDVARNLVNIALTERARNRLGPAEEHARRGLEVFESILGHHHPSTVNAELILANILHLLLRFDEAFELYESALTSTRSARGSNDLLVAKILENIAAARQSGPHPHTADAPFRECIEIKKRLLGEDDADCRLTIERYGRYVASAGDRQRKP